MNYRPTPLEPLRFRWMRARRLLADMLGIEITPARHGEKILSGSAGFIAILVVLAVSESYASLMAAPLIVASMGASAVLVFAVPHGALSQPWPVLGGHVVSALAGVFCYQWLGESTIAAAAAVALAITGMYYLRCIHPPGGATALTAVIGGSKVHALGYSFVMTPVLLNVAVLLAMGLAINNLFSWRRYPVFLRSRAAGAAPAALELRREDLRYALRELGSYIDIEEADLEAIYTLARRHAATAAIAPEALQRGAYYSNGLDRDDWEVRQIVDESAPGAQASVIYTIVDGRRRRGSGIMSKEELARWARYCVSRDEQNRWAVVDAAPMPRADTRIEIPD